jgi:cytochrome P450
MFEDLKLDAEHDMADFLDQIKQHVIRDPEPVFEVLRRVKPILMVKNTALVTRFGDVQEVLARDRIFQVTYGTKMEVVTGGRNFFLGMQNSPEYERDTAHMRSAMRREDLPGIIAPFIAKTAEELVAASNGAIDVVTLSRTVPVRWIGAYFGCPTDSEDELASWATTIFQYLFTDLTDDPALAKSAEDASAKVRAWLDETIARRKSEARQVDDVLGRCLALQSIGAPGMDDVGIRDNLLGLVVGAIATTSKCCAQALDELLKRPDQLAGAEQAARNGDDALLAQYIFEALRFNPNNPALFRIAAEDYVVAKGAPHATLIPQGATVAAATQSAMFDERVVDSPQEFRIGRPDYVSMHFGYGMHTCFGQYVNRVQIPEILKPLLQRQGLARAGELRYGGPFPISLKVTC